MRVVGFQYSCNESEDGIIRTRGRGCFWSAGKQAEFYVLHGNTGAGISYSLFIVLSVLQLSGPAHRIQTKSYW